VPVLVTHARDRYAKTSVLADQAEAVFVPVLQKEPDSVSMGTPPAMVELLVLLALTAVLGKSVRLIPVARVMFASVLRSAVAQVAQIVQWRSFSGGLT